MAYFKIGSYDYSNLVNELKVNKSTNYTAQTNAAGNTVVDYINQKRTIEVGIIPATEEDIQSLLSSLEGFAVTLSYREPRTGAITTCSCIIPDQNIEYYTIQADKVRLKAFKLKFIEL